MGSPVLNPRIGLNHPVTVLMDLARFVLLMCTLALKEGREELSETLEAGSGNEQFKKTSVPPMHI